MAVVPFAITGTDLVLRNLNREISRIKGRTRGGLRHGLLLVLRTAKPLTPHRTGNLRNSYYTEVFDTFAGPVGEIGLTADYAPYVHEMDDAAHFTTPGTGPKFLEKALQENANEIMKVIADQAKRR